MITIWIKKQCLEAKETDPILLIERLMKSEHIPMHGPIHHVLDGACLLTALHNAGLEFDLEEAIDEMILRGNKMPGAICGQWGVCGSAASIGAALSILHHTTPLSNDQYYKDHLNYVSLALSKIASIGGPRCCKRNAFLSLTTAVQLINNNDGITLDSCQTICRFSNKNKQCLHENCPFYPSNQ